MRASSYNNYTAFSVCKADHLGPRPSNDFPCLTDRKSSKAGYFWRIFRFKYFIRSLFLRRFNSTRSSENTHLNVLKDVCSPLSTYHLSICLSNKLPFEMFISPLIMGYQVRSISVNNSQLGSLSLLARKLKTSIILSIWLSNLKIAGMYFRRSYSESLISYLWAGTWTESSSFRLGKWVMRWTL